MFASVSIPSRSPPLPHALTFAFLYAGTSRSGGSTWFDDRKVASKEKAQQLCKDAELDQVRENMSRAKESEVKARKLLLTVRLKTYTLVKPEQGTYPAEIQDHLQHFFMTPSEDGIAVPRTLGHMSAVVKTYLGAGASLHQLVFLNEDPTKLVSLEVSFDPGTPIIPQSGNGSSPWRQMFSAVRRPAPPPHKHASPFCYYMAHPRLLSMLCCPAIPGTIPR